MITKNNAEILKPELKLVYFADKGRAEAARICFFIGDIEFEDEKISYKEFKQMKNDGILTQNQLPVLYIDGAQYAQSGAIIRYAARLSNLYPTDNLEIIQTEQALLNMEEILNRLGTVATIKIMTKRYSDDVINSFLPKYLSFLDNQLKNNETGYYVGNSLMVADITSASIVQMYFKSLSSPVSTTEKLPKQYQIHSIPLLCSLYNWRVCPIWEPQTQTIIAVNSSYYPQLSTLLDGEMSLKILIQSYQLRLR